MPRYPYAKRRKVSYERRGRAFYFAHKVRGRRYVPVANRRGNQMRAGVRRRYMTRDQYLPRKLGYQMITGGRRGGSMITRTSRARASGLGLKGRSTVLYVTEGTLETATDFLMGQDQIWPVETICGHPQHIAKFCFRMQPFVSHEAVDVECKHSLQGISDGTNFHAFSAVHVNEAHPDIVERMRNYSSFRIKSVRIELTIVPNSGDTNNWGDAMTNFEIFRVESSYDKFNVNGVNGGTSTTFQANVAAKRGPIQQVMRRMPHFKQKDFIPGNPIRQQFGAYGKGVQHFVLFNKVFPPPSDTSRSIVTGATDAVNPGEWDMRAVHDPNYANAFEVMQDGTLRAGALYVYVSKIGTSSSSLGTQVLAQNKEPLRWKTWYEIELKDPVDQTFFNPPPV